MDSVSASARARCSSMPNRCSTSARASATDAWRKRSASSRAVARSSASLAMASASAVTRSMRGGRGNLVRERFQLPGERGVNLGLEGVRGLLDTVFDGHGAPTSGSFLGGAIRQGCVLPSIRSSRARPRWSTGLSAGKIFSLPVGGETDSTEVKDRGRHAERHRLVNPVETTITADTQLALAA